MVFLQELQSEHFMTEPEKAYSAALVDGSPVFFENPFDDGLIVCRNELVHQIAKDPNFQAQNRKSRSMGPTSDGALAALFAYHPVFINEPEHKWSRQLAFRAVGWRGPLEIAAVASEIAKDLVINRRSENAMEIVSEYASKLAATYWCRSLGLPETAIEIIQKNAPCMGFPLRFKVSASELKEADHAAQVLGALFEEAFADPDAVPEKSALCFLFHDLRAASPQERLDAIKLLAALSFDIVDGTAGLIANGIYWLSVYPDLQQALRREPSLIKRVWAEVARLSPPILGLFRSPLREVKVEGFQIEAGTNILLLNAAANRDARVFEKPNEFNLHRDFSKIASFGGGARACLGKSLTRIVFESAISTLLKVGDWECGNLANVSWGKPGLGRAVEELRIQFE